MSTPNPDKIAIQSTDENVRELLNDLFVRPRRAIYKWSRITGQTVQVRLAYPGQHLASLITGVPGKGSAARGDDLVDGTEVKSCSRADQLGRCKTEDCDGAVLPYVDACPKCGGKEIYRKTDSHWIMSVKSEGELKQYTDATRVMFILFERMANPAQSIRVRAWEVWPGEARHKYFGLFVTDYYQNNFLAKTTKGLSPSPCNLHPLKRDFLLMNPVLVFQAQIDHPDDESIARPEIKFWHAPGASRGELQPEDMPGTSCTSNDRVAIAQSLSEEHLERLCDGSLSRSQVAALRLKGSKGSLRKVAAEIKSLDADARLAIPFKSKRIKDTNTAALRSKSRRQR
jgi:hypothetical protein